MIANIYRSSHSEPLIKKCHVDLLEQCSVEYESLFISTKLGVTHILACGNSDQPPLVLLRGNGVNTSHWKSVVSQWANYYHVLIIDIVGDPGLSALSRPKMKDSAIYTAWLNEICAVLGITGVNLVGESMGSWFVVDYALRETTNVASLTLLCPAAIGKARIGNMLKMAVLAPWGEWGKGKILKMIAGENERDIDPNFAYLFGFTVRYCRGRRDPYPNWTDAQLSRLTMPVRVVAGDEDPLFDSRNTCTRVAQCVPHSSILLLQGVGHIIPLDRIPIPGLGAVG
jgi:pimeloyl-ACP methyl ester carboxylesterase